MKQKLKLPLLLVLVSLTATSFASVTGIGYYYIGAKKLSEVNDKKAEQDLLKMVHALCLKELGTSHIYISPLEDLRKETIEDHFGGGQRLRLLSREYDCRHGW